MGSIVYGISHGLSQKHRLKLMLATFLCLIWMDIVSVEGNPLKQKVKKLYVNVPGKITIGLQADPHVVSATDLKAQLAREMTIRNMEKLDMDDHVLIYFQMVITNESKKLSYYHVPKGATLYLVKDIY